MDGYIFTGKRKGICSKCRDACYVYKLESEYLSECCGVKALEGSGELYSSQEGDFFIGDKYWLFWHDRFYQVMIDSERKIGGSYIVFVNRKTQLEMIERGGAAANLLSTPYYIHPHQLYYTLDQAIDSLKQKSVPFDETNDEN